MEHNTNLACWCWGDCVIYQLLQEQRLRYHSEHTHLRGEKESLKLGIQRQNLDDLTPSNIVFSWGYCNDLVYNCGTL